MPHLHFDRTPPEHALRSSSDDVPTRYTGIWQRRILEQDGLLDTTSLVYWLQTTRWHADLRIPADRPDFTGIADLSECDADRLAWLATQQGFCGITEVDGDRCRWRRVVDFQPDNGRRDIGQMAFNGDRLIEVGCEADYLEVWQRQADSVGGCAVLECADNAGHMPERRTWLLVAGDGFAYVRARAEALPPAAGFSELIADRRPSRAQLIEWLDFEISFGRRDGPQPWQIVHSSLPFREGAVLFPDGVPERINRALAVEPDGRRSWNIIEWTIGAL